jgi:hypothetical protein
LVDAAAKSPTAVHALAVLHDTADSVVADAPSGAAAD